MQLTNALLYSARLFPPLEYRRGKEPRSMKEAATCCPNHLVAFAELLTRSVGEGSGSSHSLTLRVSVKLGEFFQSPSFVLDRFPHTQSCFDILSTAPSTGTIIQRA